jgi:ribonuclease HII
MHSSIQSSKNTLKEKNPDILKVSAGSTFQLEKKLFADGYEIIIGIDEAGRGPLAGPVVACAAVLKDHESVNHKGFNLVRDSKTLSENQRESIFDFILENFHVGVGICDHKTIDRINILEASFLAMKKSVTDLSLKIKIREAKHIILLDGNKKIPNLSHEQKAVVHGDKIVKSISAASIIAKVTRDRIMKKMHEKYPAYQFDQHKGYGTKLHMQSLEKYGPCEIHRKSFAPVRRALFKK